MKYSKRSGARIARAQVAVIAETVNALVARDGSATAEAFVAEAADADHPLHGLFEWNNAEAGRQWRLHQARYFIGAVQVDIGGGPIGAFVSARPTHAHGVVPIQSAICDVDVARTLLARAASELEIWTRRYAILEALAGKSVNRVRAAAREMRAAK